MLFDFFQNGGDLFPVDGFLQLFDIIFFLDEDPLVDELYYGPADGFHPFQVEIDVLEGSLDLGGQQFGAFLQLSLADLLLVGLLETRLNSLGNGEL